MNALKLIDDVFAELIPQLPSEMKSALKFQPHEQDKFGVISTLGIIFGKQRGKIWDRKWCHYSLDFGPNRHHANRAGGVGFGCAVNQQTCGKGKHEARLFEVAASFCEAHPQFHHSPRGNSWLSIATWYPLSGSGFPVGQAAQDLAALITSTFAAFDAMVVRTDRSASTSPA